MKSLAQKDQSTVFLTTTPQRFGVLPTMRFWNARTPLISAAGFIVPGVVASSLVGFGGAGVVAGALVGLVSYWLPLGLFERYIRKRIRDKTRAGTTIVNDGAAD
jgi:hypothetical protein